MHPVSLIDRWERYWRVIQASGVPVDRTAFDIDGKTVFELGCGPILGWGPLALFLGAQTFYYDEPAAQPAVASSDVMRERYFLILHRELVANYGPRMNFDEFYELCMTKCQPLALERSTDVGGIDLFFSNSVLEHVPASQLEGVLSKLSQLSSRIGSYFHTIDFGPHGLVPEFDDLYRMPRAERPGDGLINLLKPSEFKTALIAAGSTCDVVLYKTLPVNQSKLHPSWRNYSTEDIHCGVAFFLGAMNRSNGATDKPGAL